jgi:hypothetical protein
MLIPYIKREIKGNIILRNLHNIQYINNLQYKYSI